MRIHEAKECVKQLFLHTDSVSALVSERGVGKTSAYRQCAEELGVGYHGLYGAALEGPDFMGLPDKDRESGLTRYLAPQFLPTKQAVDAGLFPPRGLLVLEEINRIPSDTTSVLYPLLLERRINGHALAEGWRIGVTMNPDTMNYSVNTLDDAMLDRFVVIEVTAHLDDYLDYSWNHEPNDEVLTFLKTSPDLLLVVKKASDSTATTKAPTPRAWTKVQELLNRCTLPDNLLRELVSGLVGPQAAASFFGFRQTKDVRIPATDLILTKFSEAEPDLTALVDRGRLDLLGLVVGKVVWAFRDDPVHFENLDRFVGWLPEEFRVLFLQKVARQRPDEFALLASRVPTFAAAGEVVLGTLGTSSP